MKKIMVMIFAAMLVVSLSGLAQATYWVPTESGTIDINYLTYTGSGEYAIFDDSSALSTSDSHLMLNSVADTIYFVQSGSDWDLTGSAGTFTLHDGNTFQLAWMPTGDNLWHASTGYSPLSGGVYEVSWTVSYQTHSLESKITQIDAVPSAVPLPPSAMMLFFGFLGLVGVRRMRRNG